MDLLLEGIGIIGFVHGSIPCPNLFRDFEYEEETVEITKLCLMHTKYEKFTTKL